MSVPMYNTIDINIDINSVIVKFIIIEIPEINYSTNSLREIGG